MTVLTIGATIYNVKALALSSSKWKYNEGDRVRPRDKPDSPSWIVLRRLPGYVFPHYELMDDDGYLWRFSQITLVAA